MIRCADKNKRCHYEPLKQKDTGANTPPTDDRPRSTRLVAVMVCRHCLDRQEVEL